MKDATRLLLYFAGVLLLGALLGPVLFSLGQVVIARGLWAGLARYDFETFFHRGLLIAALVLLWPLLRSLRVRSWRDLGLTKSSRRTADVVAGFLVAAVPLLLTGGFLIFCGVYRLRAPLLWDKMLGVIGAAIVVPVLEEILFRGFILGVLLRSFSRAGSVIFTSALFAIIHFMKAPEFTTPNNAVNWGSGFISLAHSFDQFVNPALLAASFLTLFVVACILADARLETRALWLPIGLHAGWIFANGIFSKIAHRQMVFLPWLGKDLLIGIVPLSIALISWALMHGWLEYARKHAKSSLSRTR